VCKRWLKEIQKAKQANFDKAVIKWYIQQQLCDMTARGAVKKSSADTREEHTKIQFKPRDGWLW
jgi:hypothetical protein